MADNVQGLATSVYNLTRKGGGNRGEGVPSWLTPYATIGGASNCQSNNAIRTSSHN